MVDSTSGKPLLTKDWPTRPRDSSIQVATGGILLRTGGTLKILSKDFVELQEIPLKQTDPYEEYEIRISASRKTILINHYSQNAQRKLYFSNFDVLDGETFKLTHNWTQRYPLRGDLYSISDTAVISAQNA